MKKILALLSIGAALAIPSASFAHEDVMQQVCTDSIDGAPSKDCVRIDTDTELENGIEVQLDGDDSDPRGDGTSDGYVHATVTRDGAVTVYCEDEGHYNYPSNRANGDDETDAENPNDACGV